MKKVAKKGGKVKDMTADEFKARHAAEVNLTIEQYDRYLVVERQGKRWISVPRVQVEREKREARQAEK